MLIYDNNMQIIKYNTDIINTRNKFTHLNFFFCQTNVIPGVLILINNTKMALEKRTK